MGAVGLVQRELAANPLDESDLMTCAVEARLACVSLYMKVHLRSRTESLS